MSRTKILTMENNMFNPTIVGFANDGNENDCFEIIFNKLLENENQCDGEFDLLTGEWLWASVNLIYFFSMPVSYFRFIINFVAGFFDEIKLL